MEMNDDIVNACADLVDRTGAKEFQIGYMHDDVPVEEAGWYAEAHYKGARILVGDQRSPTGAALALAERILSGATCKCGRLVTLSDATKDACRWKLVGDRWESGCSVPPLQIHGSQRGDVAAAGRALAERAQGNRAERRARKYGHQPE